MYVDPKGDGVMGEGGGFNPAVEKSTSFMKGIASHGCAALPFGSIDGMGC